MAGTINAVLATQPLPVSDGESLPVHPLTDVANRPLNSPQLPGLLLFFFFFFPELEFPGGRDQKLKSENVVKLSGV